MDVVRPVVFALEGRTRRFIILTLGVLFTLSILGVARAQAANNPPLSPHQINVFPRRDMVNLTGYKPNETVTVEVQHPGVGAAPVGTVTAVTDANGVLDVNHPGGACWVGVTPDIRSQDVVRVTDSLGQVDETTTANVTAGRPVQTAADTVVLHGTALQADGTPIPVAQLEARLIAPNDHFIATGTRTLRAISTDTLAANQDTLAYDDTSGNWTATWTGLDPLDVDRALNSQSTGVWLGGNPAGPPVESTNYETGAGILAGPNPPCTAPKEILAPLPGTDPTPPTTPTGLTAGVTNSNTVTLNWQPSTDNVGVVSYGIYRDGVAIANVQKADGSAPAPFTFKDLNVPPGTYTYTVDAQDANDNRSGLSNSATATTLAVAASTAVGVNDPPANGIHMLAFPSREFLSSDGYNPDDLVTVEVIRNGKVITNAPGIIPVDDPTTPIFDGTVEVNHPGGACWAGTTPELRAGDIIRNTAFRNGVVRQIDQIRVANVVANRAVQTGPTTVQIHGTAQGADGQPLPVDQIESRLVASTQDPFHLNGRRTIRAAAGGGLPGTLSYDTTNNPTGENWTATWTGLDAHDVQLALTVDARIHWNGRNPALLNEITIYEVTDANNPPGPAAAVCSSPLEPADTVAPSVPASVTTTNPAGTTSVNVTWAASTDDWYVYGYHVLRDGKVVAKLGATATSFTDTKVVPGVHSYQVTAIDSASPLGAGPTIIQQLQTGQGKPYGNESAPSTASSVTLPDITAPTVPTNLTGKAGLAADGTTRQVALNWTASTDDLAVDGYSVYRRVAGTTTWGAPIGESTTTSYTDSTVLNGKFEYSVVAHDAAGNRSAFAPPITLVVSIGDVTPPTVPGAVTATTSPDIHGKDIKVTWTAATDDSGVVSGYGVYRDGTLVGSVNGSTLSYTDTPPAAGTYKYTVDAVDSSGNRSAQSVVATGSVANDPPADGTSVIVFPQRDFVSASGFKPGNYTVDVYRNNKLSFSSGSIAAEDDPKTAGFDGLVEVNHGGNGGCWVNATPDIRPGDVIRVTGADGIPEQTTTANVVAMRPIQTGTGTVVVHGTAQDAAGNPLDISQLEARLITGTTNQFSTTGARSLRSIATDGGTIAYDAAGSTKWTATWTNLPASDVAKAMDATVDGLWLGRAPLALAEGTQYENAPGLVGGPAAAPCGPALEPGRPLATIAPSSIAFGQVNPNSVSTKTVTLRNTGTSTMNISQVYIAGADFPTGAWKLTNKCAATLAPGATCTVDVTFQPGSTLGPRTATLSILDNAADDQYQSVQLSGEAFVLAPPTGIQQVVRAGAQLGLPGTPASTTMPVEVSWLASKTAGVTYELQESTDGVNWTGVPLATGTSQSIVRDLQMKSLATPGKYQYRVRALKGALISAWNTGGLFTFAPYDDKDVNLKFGGTWTTENNAANYGGGVKFTTAKGSNAGTPKVTFTTSGTFAIIGDVGPAQGQIQVSIDGKATQLVDEYSAAADAKNGVVVYANNGLAVGQHDVSISIPGTKNNLSTGFRTDLDGFVALK